MGKNKNLYNYPLVSVIIPTYNCGKYIIDAIKSILNQTYSNIEIIVVDDGSTDDTRNILQQYIKDRSIIYVYQKNMGPASARNNGIQRSKGEYLAFLDADDLWEPDKLSKSIDFLLKGRFDWIATASRKINMSGVMVEERTMKENTYGYDSATNRIYDLKKRIFSYRNKMPIHVQTFVINKKCFQQAGLFDDSLLIHEDDDLALRFQLAGLSAGYLNEMLTIYRQRETSITKNRKLDTVKQTHILVKKYIKIFGSENKEVRKDYVNFLWEAAARYYVKNKWISCLKLLLLSMLIKFLYIFPGITRIHKKNKILYYEPSSGFGGSASALSNLVNYLNKGKFNFILITKNRGPQFGKIKNAEFIKLKEYKEPDKLSNLKFLFYFIKNVIPDSLRIYSIIKAKRVSLIHINTNIMSGIPAIIASKLSRIPCVCHIRQTRKLIKRERFFARFVEKFILINKQASDLYIQDISEEKLNIIYDGINLHEFSKNDDRGFKKEFSLDFSFVVGLVGRIVKGKGHKEFILVAKEVLKNIQNVKFIIVGDAKGDSEGYYKEVKELVKDYNLERNILFTGWRDDVKNIISDLDILVLPSTTFPEGLPNTIIEAMALRKPVIATDVAGPNEIVVNNETGFIVPPGDIKAMAEKIIYLLENPDIAKKMGEGGRKIVEGKFNIKETIKKIEEIYKEVLDEKEQKKIKKSFIYNIERLFDLFSRPSIIFKMYRCIKKDKIVTIKEFKNAKNGSYIFLKEFISDNDKYEQIKRELPMRDEFLLGDIDQDSRVLSYNGALPYFENITKDKFLPRVRYNLQIVALNINNFYIIAVKKSFGKDRLNFMKETFILDRLSLCNVPKILKLDVANNNIYMSLIPGISLRDALWGKGAKVKDKDYIDMKRQKNITNSEVNKMKLAEGKKFISQVLDENFIKNLYAQLKNINLSDIVLEDIKYGNIIKNDNNEPFFVDFHSAKIINYPKSMQAKYLINREIKAINDILNNKFETNIKSDLC